MPYYGRKKKSRKSRKRKRRRTSSMLYKNPFPPSKRKVRLFYRNTVERLPASAEDIVITNCNGMYDYDESNKLGDIQPVFRDQLLGSTGPYRAYQVVAWSTTWKISQARVNDGTYAAALNVRYIEVNAGDVAQADTVAEVMKLPGVQKRVVTDERPGVIKKSNTLRRAIPSLGAPDPITTSAAYSANPSSLVKGMLMVSGVDASAVLNYQIDVIHSFDVILYDRYVISS